MKEFEFDQNNGLDRNQQNSTPEQNSTPMTDDRTPADGNPVQNDIPAQTPANEYTPAPEQTSAQPESLQQPPQPVHQQPVGQQVNQPQMRENPYFQGYAQPQNQPPQQPQGQQPGQVQTPPMNQQNNSYWREYPYGSQQNPNQNRPVNPNPYAQQQNTGAYTPQHQYSQNGGQISYTPSHTKQKKAKEKKPVTRAALALACALTLVLSAGAGFGGAMLANRLNAQNDSGSSVNRPAVNTAVTSGDPVVIYKSVEDIATSTGNIGENLSYSQVAEMVKDSVVEIVTEFNNQSMWYQYVTQGAGSGVIISADGYVITNAHVITNESTGAVADNIVVRLTDATEYKAETIAYDADSDIAILKIEASGLTPAQCGNSDNLAVGEELVVVGNPLGELGGTVTNGIVSATQREIQMGGVTMSLIQTNAAVNPGNSGGGMFNMKGQLIGIVNAKSSGTGIEGLGFAIPINYALEISEQLLQYGYVRGKTMIGVMFQDVSGSNYFYYYNIKAGVYVAELTPGYNDKVLEVGDRVIAVNGKEITSSEDIKAVVTSCSVGDKITFQLYRDDKLMEVEVTCYEKVPETDTQKAEDSADAKKNEKKADAPDETADAFSTFPFSGGLEEFFFGGW